MRFEEERVLLVHIRRAEAGAGRAFADLVQALLGGEQGYPFSGWEKPGLSKVK